MAIAIAQLQGPYQRYGNLMRIKEGLALELTAKGIKHFNDNALKLSLSR